LVVLLAALVGILALQAKLSLYHPPHPGSINPAAASKLWVGERVKIAPLALLPILWMATVLLFRPPVRRVLDSETGSDFLPRHFRRRELYRFLRPPPAF